MSFRTLPSVVTHLGLVALLVTLAACGGDDGITGPKGSSTVTLSLSGLKTLGTGLSYRAWVVGGVAESYYGVPLVTFNAREDGAMIDTATDTILTGPYQVNLHPDEILAVGVSIELSDQLSDFSSYTFILGGDLVGATVDLTTENWLAFDVSLSDADGRFVLNTPTDADPENELSGIWFMDPSSGSPLPGLDLPEAPVGWDYEGWVVVGGQPVSTGKFFARDEQDRGDPYSGTETAPVFPGEDFLAGAPEGLTFPADLSGSSVFITMEPWDTWDVELQKPFFLRILEAQIPAEAAPGTPYPMTSRTGQLPSGTATVQAWSATSGSSG